jgi:Mrp family chromosome partitioning ATPase
MSRMLHALKLIEAKQPRPQPPKETSPLENTRSAQSCGELPERFDSLTQVVAAPAGDVELDCLDTLIQNELKDFQSIPVSIEECSPYTPIAAEAESGSSDVENTLDPAEAAIKTVDEVESALKTLDQAEIALKMLEQAETALKLLDETESALKTIEKTGIALETPHQAETEPKLLEQPETLPNTLDQAETALKTVDEIESAQETPEKVELLSNTLDQIETEAELLDQAATSRVSALLPEEPGLYVEMAEYIITQLTPGRPAVLLLTSAGDGAGKTATLYSLSKTLAKHLCGNVLVVDADFRRPDLTRFWGEPFSTGLQDILSGKSEWQKAVQRTSLPRLHILPNKGPMHDQERPIVGGDWGRLFEQLKRQYQLVLVDAPTLAHEETASLISHCDGVYLAVRLGYTTPRLVRDAVSVIQQAGGTLLGGIAIDQIRS